MEQKADGLKTRNALHAEPWLVVGASLYWASIIVQFLLPLHAPGSSLSFVDLTMRYLLLALFTGLGFLVPRLFSTVRGRNALTGLVCVCSLASCIAPASDAVVPWDWIRLVINSFSVATLMVVWGFAFASMDKREAGQNVAVTALVTAMLVLVMLGLARFVPVSPLSRAVMALSGLVVLGGRIRFAAKRRTHAPEQRKPLAYFLLSRSAFGIVMGFCLEIPLHLEPDDTSPVLLAMGLAALIASVNMYVRSSDKLYTALPTLLFLSVGITYLPFFEQGLQGAAGASVGIVWFAWAIFSAFQLSDLKERCGMGELTLCLAEKTVLSLAIVAGILLYRLFEAALAGQPSAAVTGYIAFAGTMACVLASSGTMARLVSARKEDEMRADLLRTRREREEALYDRIAREFGLSTREHEVLRMLADGYTRTYIREALGISDGTAKAHIAHVYQKLDIHRKDDLLDLIDRRLNEV